MMTLSGGKTAIITGAGKGMGLAIAHALAKEGVSLGLISRTASDLETLADTLKASYSIQVSLAAADVSVNQEVQAAVASITEQLGSIDILINNAGIAKFGTVLDMDPEEWKEHDGCQFIWHLQCDSRCTARYDCQKWTAKLLMWPPQRESAASQRARPTAASSSQCWASPNRCCKRCVSTIFALQPLRQARSIPSSGYESWPQNR